MEVERERVRVLRARVRVLEGEVESMRGKVRVLLAKSAGDDEVIDRLRVEVGREREGREREMGERERVEGKVGVRERGWEEELRGLKERWESRERAWGVEREGKEREWEVYRQGVEGMLAQLQGRCDELERERVEWRKAGGGSGGGGAGGGSGVEGGIRRGSGVGKKGRGGKAAEGGGGEGSAGGGKEEKVGEVKRRLLEMVGEREFIRESYAAMLSRRDEEMDGWKRLREKEKAEEQRMRQSLQAVIAQLTSHSSPTPE